MPGDLTLWHNRRDTLLRFVDVRAEATARLTDGLAARAALAGARGAPDADGQAARVVEADAAVELCHHPEHLAEQIPDDRPFYSVYIPIGISPGMLGRHNITVEYSIDMPYPFERDRAPFAARQRAEARGAYPRIGLDRNNALGHITRITPDFIARLRYVEHGRPDARRVRPYLEMNRVFEALPAGRRPAYYEAVLHYVPKGARLRYRVKVYSRSREPNVIPPQADLPAESDWYSVFVIAPTFGREHIKYCPPRPNTPDVNVAYWRTDPVHDPVGAVPNRSLLTFRFDSYDVRRAINDFSISFARPGCGADRPSQLTCAWFFDGADPGPWFAERPISSSWHLPDLAVVNHQFDYVTLTVPLDRLVEGEQIFWRGRLMATVVGGELVSAEPATDVPLRLMFIHYANQSLNDMFESPNKSYDPPRTYTQTTMYDELGTYSSRPTSNETGVGDGYGYVLEAHRRNGLPCLFSLNGGFLSMLAQDLPAAVDVLKGQMADGQFEPVIGGFAGHRMLYFGEETNRQAIQRGIEMIEQILGHSGHVFYPNSRLYAPVPHIDGPIRNARIAQPLLKRQDARTGRENRIRFVVVDESAFGPIRAAMAKDGGVLKPGGRLAAAPPRAHDRDVWEGHEYAYIWQQRCEQHRPTNDPCTASCDTWYWLFISGKLKDDLLGASDDEWQAGKLLGNLRQHFFYGISQPERLRGLVQVYSDDADKAAGNGWFDGDYGGTERHWAAIFAAALEWIAAHPWISVITAASLEPEQECLGTIDLRQAIDPYIHQDPDLGADPGRQPRPTFWSDGYEAQKGFDCWSKVQRERLDHVENDGKKELEDLGFEYARWYRAWRDAPAIWLNTSLGDLATAVEQAVMTPELSASGNEPAWLAQLGFLIGIHEAHWSKKPLEELIPRADFDTGSRIALRAYRRKDMLEPENFVLAQSLQLRNAHVFLCAARWAELLSAARPERLIENRTYKSEGPLIDDLRNSGTGAFGPHRDGVHPELHWDLDLTENVILYNRQLLVVLDSNGGRITHIFAIDRSGQPVVVSGNIKAYQFLGDDRTYGGTLNCNGSVIQNTVSVANHRYVGSDVRESLAQAGKRDNPKTKISMVPEGQNVYKVEDGTFGVEDWLYPDNFDEYERSTQQEAPDSVAWSFPGRSWKPVPYATSKAFDQDLADYREWILRSAPMNEYVDRHQRADGRSFTKTIQLESNRISIRYSGDFRAGHRVANELSLDLYRMVMHGTRQQRAWAPDPTYVKGVVPGVPPEPRGCILTATSKRIQATITLDDDAPCRFSDDTLEATHNLRLHRAFSDCLEIESVDGRPFSYTIAVDLP